MSDVRIECKYRGRVRQPPSSEHWWRFASRRPIGTRRIPAASDVPTLPIATAATAADELRPRLSGAHPPDDPLIGRDPEQLDALDKALHGDYRKLLHEKARLDRAYHRLFLTALAYKVEPPLALSNGGTTLPVFDHYTPDLQDLVGDPNWVPSLCSWRVEATLYEVSDAKSYDANSKAHGRSLKLQSPPDHRSDLVALPDSALHYPRGTSKADYPDAFVARAALLD